MTNKDLEKIRRRLQSVEPFLGHGAGVDGLIDLFKNDKRLQDYLENCDDGWLSFFKTKEISLLSNPVLKWVFLGGDENKKLLQDLFFEYVVESYKDWESNQPDFSPTAKESKGYIYVYKNAHKYKIGVTETPKKRLHYYKTACSTEPKFEVCVFVKNPYKVEALLHESYRSKNLQREWFKLTKKDLKDIEKFLGERCCPDEK